VWLHGAECSEFQDSEWREAKQAAEPFPTCRLLEDFPLTEWAPQACGPHCRHMRLDHARILNMSSLRCISASSACIHYYSSIISRRVASEDQISNSLPGDRRVLGPFPGPLLGQLNVFCRSRGHRDGTISQFAHCRRDNEKGGILGIYRKLGMELGKVEKGAGNVWRKEM